MDNDTIKEVAKTTGKGFDLLSKLGSFIGKYSDEPMQYISDMISDKLAYMKTVRQIRYIKRIQELSKLEGIKEPIIPLKFQHMIPLIQAASLEENDDIQDLYAKLLINATNPDSKVEINRTYIDILERLSSFDAQILDTIYKIPYEDSHHIGVVTTNLPDEAHILSEIEREEPVTENVPSEKIVLALAKLANLGCISPRTAWGGGESFKVINQTILGKYFIEACTLESDKGKV